MTPSGMWSPAYLHRALELVGPERLLFSTDYPYQYQPGQPGRRFLEAAALSADQQGVVRARQLGAADAGCYAVNGGATCLGSGHFLARQLAPAGAMTRPRCPWFAHARR